jgi:peptide/nickel transport system substrate-binding protein
MHVEGRKAIGRGAVIAIVVVIVLIAAFAAYYASMIGQPTSSSSSTSSSQPSTTTSSSSSSTTSSTSGGQSMLSITWANVPVTDPAKGSDEASSAALVNLYDTLVFPTPSGALQPDLATSWTVSQDGLTYTFHLRNGVTFHNGDTLKASDVVFSMNRLLTVGQGYAYLFTPYIANVSAPDQSTVVFTLKKPFGPFLSALVRLYVLDQSQVVAHESSGTYGNNGDYGSTWLLTHDAGSGPYTILSANLESNMVLQEYTNYWNGTQPNQPQLVQFIGTTDPSTVHALFASHSIQITDQWQEYSNVVSLSQLKGAKLVTIPTVNEMYLMMNTRKPPTDDIYVREAMFYALNYTAIVSQVFPGSEFSAGPVPRALPGHDPNIPVSQQNLTLAKELIKKSKYYGQLDNYPVTYYWVTQVPAEQKMALQFASDMAQIGIKVNVVGQPWLTVVADLANITSSPNIVSIEDGASYFEAGSILQSRYTSAAEGTWEQNEWLHNSTLDNMIGQALSTQNRTERFNMYYTIQEQIYRMYPTIYAFDVTEVRAYYPSVVNWYAANGHPNPLLGYDFFFRDIQFYPQALSALG